MIEGRNAHSAQTRHYHQPKLHITLIALNIYNHTHNATFFRVQFVFHPFKFLRQPTFNTILYSLNAVHFPVTDLLLLTTGTKTGFGFVIEIHEIQNRNVWLLYKLDS